MITTSRVALAALALAACVPSQQALFAPVARDVHGRIGADVAWRDGQPSPYDHARIAGLLLEPLTADAAVAIALAGNAELQATFAELAIRGAELGEVTPPDPHVDAVVRFPVSSGHDHTDLELDALIDLRDLIALPFRRGAATAAIEAARRDAAAAAIQLATTARIDFYDAVAAGQLVALHRAVVESTDAALSLMRALHQAGNVTDLELAEQQAFHEQAGLDLAAAEQALADARSHLDATLGVTGPDTAWTTIAALPEPPATAPATTDLERAAVTASLELEALRWQLTAGGEAIGAARVASLPGLEVGVAGTRESERWSAGPAVSLRLPIFDRGQGKRAAAWAELRRTQQRYAAQAIRLRAQARAAASRLVHAHQRALHLRDVILPLRQRVLDEAVLQYNAMERSPFELVVARQAQIDAGRQYVEAVRAYWVAVALVDQLRAGASPADQEPQ